MSFQPNCAKSRKMKKYKFWRTKTQAICSQVWNSVTSTNRSLKTPWQRSTNPKISVKIGKNSAFCNYRKYQKRLDYTIMKIYITTIHQYWIKVCSWIKMDKSLTIFIILKMARPCTQPTFSNKAKLSSRNSNLALRRRNKVTQTNPQLVNRKTQNWSMIIQNKNKKVSNGFLFRRQSMKRWVKK